ncbi:LLM class flavin-dependent oxidoreductase [Actinoplanes sp. KI2]|uniref:LLM class flavin-dependent oxidoreductase n=1 Tax=Actinoplanes sp. KI2 TaxID=2983315 RepID=UPI0021D58D51|nr:LLM class flavin-dependent oxidoreductase [Actinoplanes sp. KI2]MCU7727554.1 LLM class flavin-dependent oxidoreductase [Actinoplanes sp. KI2]
MYFAVEIDGAGAHPAADGDGDSLAAATAGQAAARAAETAGFDLVTQADSALPPPGGGLRLEAGVRAAYLARRTRRIGIAPTLHVTVTEPFHLATQLASLDHASLGRAGWVVGADNSAAALATVGDRPLPAEDLRREVADVIDVCRRLWDSWEDDAIIRDRATGRFLHADRVHHVNFAGARFSVTGPLITPRPPQGQVVVLGADTLGVTGRLDVALIAAPSLDEVAERARQARADGAPLVFAELDVLLGAERLAGLDAVRPWGPPVRLRHTGRAEELRALLARLAGLVDGVRLHPAVLATDLPRLAAALRPGPGSGGTLRDRLRLPRPANRFATAR